MIPLAYGIGHVKEQYDIYKANKNNKNYSFSDFILGKIKNGSLTDEILKEEKMKANSITTINDDDENRKFDEQQKLKECVQFLKLEEKSEAKAKQVNQIELEKSNQLIFSGTVNSGKQKLSKKEDLKQNVDTNQTILNSLYSLQNFRKDENKIKNLKQQSPNLKERTDYDQQQINDIFKKVLNQSLLDYTTQLQQFTEINQYLNDEKTLKSIINNNWSKVDQIVSKNKIFENEKLIRELFELKPIHEDLHYFIQDVQNLVINILLQKKLQELNNDFATFQRTSKFLQSKQNFIKKGIQEWEITEVKEYIEKFLENNIIDLICIFINKDMYTLKQLFGITSSTPFVSRYEILNIKTKIMLGKDTIIPQSVSNNQNLTSQQTETYRQTQIQKIYFLLSFKQYESCYDSILDVRKSFLNLTKDNFFDEIIHFVKNKCYNMQLELLIDVLECKDLQSVNETYQKIINFFKKEKNLNINELDEFKNYIQLIIQKFSQYNLVNMKQNINGNQNNNHQNNDQNKNNQNNNNYNSNNLQNNDLNINNQNNNSQQNQQNGNENQNENLNIQIVRKLPKSVQQFAKEKYILSLDGGGVKGIIQLIWLVVLEELTNKSCDIIFYFIGGTSIGGIIALALRVGKKAKDILKILIETFRKQIFEQSKLKKMGYGIGNFFSPNYFESINPNSQLIKNLKEQIFLNPDAQKSVDKYFTLNDIKKNTLITSAYLDECDKIKPVCFVKFETEENENVKGQIQYKMYQIQSQLDNPNQPVVFLDNQDGFNYKLAPLYQIAACTSAAYPIFNKVKFNFEGLPKSHTNRYYVDGGYLFNNVDILMIEFIKQMDAHYNQNTRLTNYILFSVGNEPSILNRKPQLLNDYRDNEIQLPKTALQIYFQQDYILNKSEKNQEQSIFLTKSMKEIENFEYIRLTPNYQWKIDFDDVSFKNLDDLQSIGHNFIQSIDWQNISDSLSRFQFIPKEIVEVENFEKIYANEYEKINSFIQVVENNLGEIQNAIETIVPEIDSLSVKFNEIDQNIQQNLIDLLKSLLIRGEIKMNKMIDTRKFLDPIGFFEQVGYYINFLEDGEKIYQNNQFKGVAQLAASVGSIKTLELVISLTSCYEHNNNYQEHKFLNQLKVKLERINGILSYQQLQIIKSLHSFTYAKLLQMVQNKEIKLMLLEPNHYNQFNKFKSRIL